MIVDSSAIIALLMAEAQAEEIALALTQATVCKMSAANALEASIVISHKKGEAALTDLDDLYRAANITIEPVTEQHYYQARSAYLRFGKGKHKAALNFGDCFAYTLASEQQDALLYVGDDFSYTDVESVL